MKKILFVCLLVLSGCGCIIGQIPPQYIYAGAGCQAPLPDYISKVTVSDNCIIASVIQTPAPGFLLTSLNMITDVMIKATDNSGNFSEMKFTVALLDTIKPIITVDTALLGYNIVKATEFYDLADSYAKNLFPDPDSALNHKWLIVISHQDSAGFRERMIQIKDSLSLPN